MDLNLKINTPSPKQPTEEVTVHVEGDAGSNVTLLVVNRALLDLAPFDFETHVTAFKFSLSFMASHHATNLRNTVSPTAMEAASVIWNRRVWADPWVKPLLHNLKPGEEYDLELSDEDFFGQHSEQVSKFPIGGSQP